MIKFTSPLFVTLPRKTKKDKRVSLNLNTYRNLHYLVNNQAKKVYKEVISKQLKGIRFDNPIEITFNLYKASERRIDRANVLSIVEKYFCDAMTELGVIEDDNDNFITSTHYYSGGKDKDNPRVDIEITEIDQKK